MPKTITATRFKAECLALLDGVAEAGDSLVVTKRGKPVAVVGPVQAPDSLRGSVRFNVSDDDLLMPLPERWDADSP
ncbi:MAG TPA: type II toxin-antitoxin system prevent-host-death family antitoxin [Solirubrobacteraceae bacterium]|nr:type II toxin-antitoxin system prevent-host-death family antitoxin [Solirubrobacteraceae bacterium]